MKKKIVSIAVMLMMGLAIMPVCTINAASEIKNVTLTADREEQIVVPDGANITLDLAGYNLTVTGSSAIRVENGGTLTIIDNGHIPTGETNKVYGKITAVTDGNSALAVLQGGTAYIESGSFEAGYYVIKNFGTVTIADATVTSIKSASAATIDNGWYGNDSSDKVDGIIYKEAEAVNPNAVMTINGGTFSGNGSTTTVIKNDDFGTITVNGGTYTNAYWGAQNNNAMTVNGGTFTTNNTAYPTAGSTYPGGAIRSRGADVAGQSGLLTINGGTFTSTTTNTYAISAEYGGTTTVYNGTFTGNIGTATNTKYTDPKFTIYGGTYTADAAVVKSFMTTNSEYLNGNVSTKTVSEITKYVLFKSEPAETTFTYNISNVKGQPDTVIQKASKSGTASYEEVRDGISPELVKFTSTGTTSSTLTFGNADFSAKPLANTLASKGVTDAKDDRFYAAKTFNVDFSGVTFTAPGVYRYMLTEDSSNKLVPASGVLYFDVYVSRGSAVSTDAEYNNYKVTAVIAHTSAELKINTVNGASVAETKTTYLPSFSVQQAMNLTVKHYSLGNQASKTEQYKYTLTIRNATKGSTISYIRDDGSKGAITVKNNGLSTYDFYLKDHQAITFINISGYPGYTIEADETTMKSELLRTATKIEDYQLATNTSDTPTLATTKAKVSSAGADTMTTDDTTVADKENTAITVNGVLADDSTVSDTTSKYVVDDAYLTKDSTIVFSVYRQGTIPTGVILSVAPYAVVVLAGFFGLIVFAVKRRNRDEEEDA